MGGTIKNFDEEYLKKLERNWNRWKNDREEGERERENKEKWEEYMKEIEEKIEWSKEDQQASKIIWGYEKEVPLEAEP